MNFFLKYKLLFIGALLGGISGYLYYYFVGCSQGTCAITSDPIHSTLYGIVTGGLIIDSFRKKEPVNPQKNNEQNNE